MDVQAPLLQLPSDALLAVLRKLNPQDLLRCASCCRLLASLCFSECLWMALCNRWGNVLDISAWRNSFHSGHSLYRTLHSLDHLVGLWTAQGQQPRGSILYITWGNTCLNACKVVTSLTGELKLARMFKITALGDSSYQVEFVRKDPQSMAPNDSRIGAKLLWDPKNASEFILEAREQPNGLMQTISQDAMIEQDDRSFLTQLLRPYQSGRNTNPGSILPDIRTIEIQEAASDQVSRARRVDLLQHLLEHRLASDDDQDGSQEATGISFSQRTLQYLLRLASPARNNLGVEGQSSEARCREQREVLRCSYNRFTVAEATTNTDLVGLWIGIYGPHGAEIIHVTQAEDGIFGTKITGDPNVPCGQVSFRASLCSQTSAVPVELQQIVDLQVESSFKPFRIVTMFEGKGRIAGHNFRNPLWVPGHLLVSSSNEIAFLWEDVNFVVPFKKLSFEELYRSQMHSGSLL
ncbi:hypothetical protein KP509_18G035000 [Ceratopteris richardii]|uniref:F-box domain-containing protein n=1 Tax=Ceratopteris richardii TaxID=49495 RepID=A0A8T2SRV0_CERRI|nr:hypothetical protein KP509_18G035000 [Ceratopteris richardii]